MSIFLGVNTEAPEITGYTEAPVKLIGSTMILTLFKGHSVQFDGLFQSEFRLPVQFCAVAKLAERSSGHMKKANLCIKFMLFILSHLKGLYSNKNNNKPLFYQIADL